jgi:hypothetical protein
VIGVGGRDAAGRRAAILEDALEPRGQFRRESHCGGRRFHAFIFGQSVGEEQRGLPDSAPGLSPPAFCDAPLSRAALSTPSRWLRPPGSPRARGSEARACPRRARAHHREGKPRRTHPSRGRALPQPVRETSRRDDDRLAGSAVAAPADLVTPSSRSARPGSRARRGFYGWRAASRTRRALPSPAHSDRSAAAVPSSGARRMCRRWRH